MREYPVVILNGKRLIAMRECDEDTSRFGYPLVDLENKNGTSYAHVKGGKVRRFHEVIADEVDIIETEEWEEVSGNNLLSGIKQMLDLF